MGGLPADLAAFLIACAANLGVVMLKKVSAPVALSDTSWLSTKWGDPKNFPWTMGWQPNYQSESKVFAGHIMETKPRPGR